MLHIHREKKAGLLIFFTRKLNCYLRDLTHLLWVKIIEIQDFLHHISMGPGILTYPVSFTAVIIGYFSHFEF